MDGYAAHHIWPYLLNATGTYINYTRGFVIGWQSLLRSLAHCQQLDDDNHNKSSNNEAKCGRETRPDVDHISR
jgi:hypothetical protein